MCEVRELWKYLFNHFCENEVLLPSVKASADIFQNRCS